MAAKSKQFWTENPSTTRPLNGMHPYSLPSGTPLNGSHFEQPLHPPADNSDAQPSSDNYNALPGQAQGIEDSREPGGQAPTEAPEDVKRREDEILSKARVIRALRGTISIAENGPWPEPQRKTDQWSYLLREAVWLSTDVAQERKWKFAAARVLAAEASKFDRSKLRAEPGKFGLEIRTLTATTSKAAGTLQRVPKCSGQPNSAGAKTTGTGLGRDQRKGSASTKHGLPLVHGGSLTYEADLPSRETVLQHLYKLVEKVATAKDMAVWKYKRAFEKSLQEAREQALAARKQLTAEIRGRERTPAIDFEDAFGKQAKRRKARSSYEEASVEPEISLPAKRVSTYRKQASRPLSGISDEARRDLESGVETSGRRDRESKRKRRKMEYEDDDYEEPHRLKDPKSRKIGTDKLRPGMRTDPRRIHKRGSILARQGSRHLDPESVLVWTPQDDSLLSSVVHEFGPNWLLVSDILSSAMRMTGIRRSALQCKARFYELSKPHAPNGEDTEIIDILTAMRINKVSARDTIAKSLPVPDAVLLVHQKVLHSLCQSQRERLIRNRETERVGALHMTEPHPTVAALERQILQQNGGRSLTPAQIAEANDAQISMHAAQQQAAQAAAAAPPVAPGMSGGPAVAHSSPAANSLAQHQGMQQALPGSAPSHQAHLMQPPGSSMHLQGLSSLGNVPRAAGTGMPQAGYANPQAQAMPPPAVNTQRAQASLSQLQEMLRTGKAPNGHDLTPQQRQMIIQKVQTMRANRTAISQGMPGSPAARPPGGMQFNQTGIGRPMQGPQISHTGMPGGNPLPGQAAMQGLPAGQLGQIASTSQGLASHGMQYPAHMQGHLQNHLGGVPNQPMGQLQAAHLNAAAPTMQGQAQPGNPNQNAQLNVAGPVHGQQMGAMQGSLPAQLANTLHGHAPMGSHMAGRGQAYPAGYAAPGQLQAGLQGMMGRPHMAQRPALPQVPGARPPTGMQPGDAAGQTPSWPHSIGQPRMQGMPTSMAMQMNAANGLQPDMNAPDSSQLGKGPRPQMSVQPGVASTRPQQ